MTTHNTDPSPDRTRLIEQIKAMLARADSPFEEEARTSLFLAHKKMKEHGITYGDLGLPSSTPTLTEDQRYMLEGEAIIAYMQAIGSMGGTARAKSLTDAELTRIAYQGVDARMRKVSAKRRSEIARRAAEARWGKRPV